jgi:uncharacterized protein YndB with AHSA1/START domain
MPWEYVPEPGVLRMRLHLQAPPEAVFRFLSTDEGRASFWAETAQEADSVIHWEFPSGEIADLNVYDKSAPSKFSCEYLGDTVVEFELESDGREGTDLTVTQRGVPDESLAPAAAGWSSVLMNLKSVVDNGIDLRNHSSDRASDRGFVDN